MEVPPHIGIGDEVDTLANWDKIDIHPPRRDELSLLVMEKYGKIHASNWMVNY